MLLKQYHTNYNAIFAKILATIDQQVQLFLFSCWDAKTNGEVKYKVLDFKRETLDILMFRPYHMFLPMPIQHLMPSNKPTQVLKPKAVEDSPVYKTPAKKLKMSPHKPDKVHKHPNMDKNLKKLYAKNLFHLQNEVHAYGRRRATVRKVSWHGAVQFGKYVHLSRHA